MLEMVGILGGYPESYIGYILPITVHTYCTLLLLAPPLRVGFVCSSTMDVVTMPSATMMILHSFFFRLMLIHSFVKNQG